MCTCVYETLYGIIFISVGRLHHCSNGCNNINLWFPKNNDILIMINFKTLLHHR